MERGALAKVVPSSQRHSPGNERTEMREPAIRPHPLVVARSVGAIGGGAPTLMDGHVATAIFSAPGP